MIFGVPVEAASGFWRCPLKIEWPSGRVTKVHGQGLDTLDALLNAVALARINIVSYDEWNKGNVTWLDDTNPQLEVEIPVIPRF